MSTSDELQKKYIDAGDGKKRLRRVGTPEQWKEREDMQIANTSENLRARAINNLIKTNGHVGERT